MPDSEHSSIRSDLAPRLTKRMSHKRRVTAALVGIALGIGVAACSHPSAVQTAPATPTPEPAVSLSGHVVFSGTLGVLVWASLDCDEAGAAAIFGGKYANISAASVALSADGQTLDVSKVGSGESRGNHTQCVFPFTLTLRERRDFYRVEVGTWGRWDYSREDIIKPGALELKLGP